MREEENAPIRQPDSLKSELLRLIEQAGHHLGLTRTDVYERRATEARKLLANLTGTNDDGGNKDAVIPGGGVEFVPATESVFNDMTGF